MDEKQTNGILPKTIIVEGERKKTDQELRQSLREAQEAYKALLADTSLEDVPEPKGCTEEWLGAICERGQSAAMKAEHLTMPERKSLAMAWGRIFSKNIRHIHAIWDLLEKVPIEQVVYDDTLKTLYIENIDKLCIERATHGVPAEATEHLQKMHQVLNSIQNLRDWEQSHDVRKIPLDQLLRFGQQRFIEAWVSGSILRDHSQDNKAYMQTALASQRAAEQQYL